MCTPELSNQAGERTGEEGGSPYLSVCTVCNDYIGLEGTTWYVGQSQFETLSFNDINSWSCAQVVYQNKLDLGTFHQS